LYEKAKTQAWGPFTPLALILLIALMIAVVAFIVLWKRAAPHSSSTPSVLWDAE